jgi:hypothetical protein
MHNFRDWCCHLYGSCSSAITVDDGTKHILRAMQLVRCADVYVLLFGVVYLASRDFQQLIRSSSHMTVHVVALSELLVLSTLYALPCLLFCFFARSYFLIGLWAVDRKRKYIFVHKFPRLSLYITKT